MTNQKETAESFEKRFKGSVGLFDAIKRDDVEDIRRRMEQGFHPAAQQGWGLRLAAKSNAKKCLRLFLDLGVPAESANYQAFEAAAEGGHLEVLKILFRALEASDGVQAGRDPMNAAIAYGHDAVIEFLWEQGLRFEIGVCSAACDAASRGHASTLRLIGEKGFSLGFNDGAILHSAAVSPNVQVLQVLIENAGVDPSLQKGIALSRAAKHDLVENVRYLVSKGMDKSLIVNPGPTVVRWLEAEDLRRGLKVRPNNQCNGTSGPALS